MIAPVDDRVERLREIPLFAELDEAALERVAACAKEAEFPAGAVMIERAQPGLGMFVLLEGSARAELRDREIKFGPGDFVGELSLLVEQPRAARVLAVTPIRCLAIHRADFAELLETEPRIATAMLRVVAERLVRMLDAPH